MEQQPQKTAQMKSPYVGFWVRVAAYLIDLCLPLGLWILVEFSSAIYGSWSIFDIDESVFFIGIFLCLAYFICMTYFFQATLGKMLVGIKVVGTEGERLTFGRVLFRETIGKLLSKVIFNIGYVMVAFTPKKQGLHDMIIADSVVIYKDPYRRANVLGISLGLISLGALIFIFIAVMQGFFGYGDLVVPRLSVSDTVNTRSSSIDENRGFAQETPPQADFKSTEDMTPEEFDEHRIESTEFSMSFAMYEIQRCVGVGGDINTGSTPVEYERICFEEGEYFPNEYDLDYLDKLWPGMLLGWSYQPSYGSLADGTYAYSATDGKTVVTCTIADLICTRN